MRAVMCTEFNDDNQLSVGDAPAPTLGDGSIRIAVAAAGVNFADVLMIAGRYQVKPPLPFTPGLEVAGTVAEVSADVGGFRVGDRVMGVGEMGAFAEEAVLPASAVFQIPDTMDFTTAAAFPVAYGTSHGALEWRARLQPGETLVVLGAAGGVGLTAVEVGKAMGATVIAMAGGADKLAIAKDHGADHLVDYSKENIRDRIREITGGRGADVILDPVGGDAFDACLRAVAWEGRMVTIGFAGGKVQQIPANLVLVKNCDVIGFYWGSYLARRPDQVGRSYEQLFRWYGESRLKPRVSATLPFERAGDALNLLSQRRATGKVVVTPR